MLGVGETCIAGNTGFKGVKGMILQEQKRGNIITLFQVLIR